MTSNIGRYVAGDRYRIEAQLGAGAMGEVYRAYDSVLGHEVALKVLRVAAAQAEDLYHLKREFRALAGLHHPNLVSLYDLVVGPELSFFTMEVVEGVDLVRHVRGDEDTATAPLAPDGIERLRAALGQLLDGLTALHAAGRFHRDIKPSNVLVTGAGRVVLVDFGVASARPLAGSDRDDGIAGTPAYMAPELLLGGPPSEASDGYALGVTLYVALTGELPFRGTTGRRRGPAPSPKAAAPATPDAIDRLVRALLDEDPEKRPADAEIREAIGGGDRPAAALPSTVSLWEAPFVDRHDALRELETALGDVRSGRAVTLRVEGPSGIGKSALIRHFLSAIESEERVLVLAGRCYPQESMPFKALDQVIDGLSRLLVELPADELAVVTRGVSSALEELFPVLGRVPGFVDPEVPVPTEADERRRRGFDDLRALFGRLAARYALVVWIDDLQWGDADSAVLLRALADPREAPPLLLLLSHRAAEWEMSVMQAALTSADGTVLGRALALEPLPASEAQRLADVLLGGGAASAADRIDDIVRDAGGNPFLVCELARYCVRTFEAAGDEAAPRATTLPVGIGAIVQQRVAALQAEVRGLLSVVAVAGRPCPRSVVGRAAGMESAAAAVTILRNECLLRDSAGEDIRVETYHDRIRESIVEALADDDRRRIHLALASAYEHEGKADPFVLVEHYVGGGDDERAASTAVVAAERANATLAFEQAARLYELALRFGKNEKERPRLMRARADALSQAGRGGDAGQVYREVAALLRASDGRDADVHESIRLAAEQYLRSGYVEEGRAALREVLGDVGERYPETAGGALVSFVRQRAAITIRGLGYRRRSADSLPPSRLRRIDACWAAAEGLIWADGLRSSDFQARYARLALAAGEPTRVVRALCTEAAFQALVGAGWGAQRGARALAEAHALAAELGSPLAEGLVEVCAAGASYLSGDFPNGYTHSMRAEEILRTRCTGVAWELTNAHIFGNWSLAHMGELDKLRAAMPELLRRARERGDLLAHCCLVGGIANSMPLIAEGSLDEARRSVDEAVRRWPTKDFQLPNYFALVSHSLVDLYSGEARAAWRRIEETWPTIRAVGLVAFRLVRIEARQLRARCGLAALGGGLASRDVSAIVSRARRTSRQIARERMPWAGPLARALDASLATWEGRTDDASRALAEAAYGFEAAAMHLWAAAARHQRGEAAGGAEMTARGVRDPDRYAEMLIPIASLRRTSTARS